MDTKPELLNDATNEIPQAYIGRQPVLDHSHTIIGYELFFRHSANATAAIVSNDLEAGTKVMVNTFSNMDANWLLGDKLAFINVSAPVLESDFLELLPSKKIVLELNEIKEITPELLARIKALKFDGFQIALDNFDVSPTNGALVPLADYIKFDVRTQDREKTRFLLNALKEYPVKLVAQKVESIDDFNDCVSMGFKFFQGYYFARPETLVAKIINPAHAAVLDLLNKVRNHADIKDIELGFKSDVALSFKLLRYINSVGFGMGCEIQSIKHALTILGYRQLYRWLTLLLATANDEQVPTALMKTAITRGRITELLGHDYLNKNERDNLFVVGIFSLLDMMLDMPLETILEQLYLQEDVTEALLNRGGIYGPFLTLAEACESDDTLLISKTAESLSIDPGQVNRAHMEALAWVEKLNLGY